MVHTNNIKPEVSENAKVAGKYWTSTRPNGTPYTPANGGEGDWFEQKWCRRCTKELNKEECEILTLAWIGEQPSQWFYHCGNPVCSEFTPVNQSYQSVPPES